MDMVVKKSPARILQKSPQRKIKSLWNLKLKLMTEKLTTKNISGKICGQTCTHEAKTCACASKCAHTHIYASCAHSRTWYYMKLYENCTDSPLLCHGLKFKISLGSELLLRTYLPNYAEYACKRHNWTCKDSTLALARVCFVCACVCTDLYKTFFGSPPLCYKLKFQMS